MSNLLEEIKGDLKSGTQEALIFARLGRWPQACDVVTTTARLIVARAECLVGTKWIKARAAAERAVVNAVYALAGTMAEIASTQSHKASGTSPLPAE